MLGLELIKNFTMVENDENKIFYCIFINDWPFPDPQFHNSGHLNVKVKSRSSMPVLFHGQSNFSDSIILPTTNFVTVTMSPTSMLPFFILRQNVHFQPFYLKVKIGYSPFQIEIIILEYSFRLFILSSSA